MKVLVSDTSVLIDLERAGFLEAAFRLPYEFAAPDLLYKRELADFGGPDLVARGLRVEELSDEELARAQDARRQSTVLSLPDAFAFSLALSRGWVLLTGDGALRSLAQHEGVPFHGILWVADELLEHGAHPAHAILDGLEALAAHPRCRLPRAELAARVGQLRALLGD